MKKTLLMLAAIGMFLAYSCKEEVKEPSDTRQPEQPEQPEELKFLAGTYWVAESELHPSGEKRIPMEEGHKYELQFTSETEVTCRIYMSPTETWSLSGTYKYEQPKIVFKGATIPIGDFLSQVGIIDGYSGDVTDEGTLIASMLLYGDVGRFIEFRKQTQP
jgi:hypothetical protein